MRPLTTQKYFNRFRRLCGSPETFLLRLNHQATAILVWTSGIRYAVLCSSLMPRSKCKKQSRVLISAFGRLVALCFA